jgi:hypothetical protein
VSDREPAKSHFLGTSERRVTIGERVISLSVKVDMQSSLTDFHVILTRKVFENDQLVKEKVWDEVIPRDFQ